MSQKSHRQGRKVVKVQDHGLVRTTYYADSRHQHLVVCQDMQSFTVTEPYLDLQCGLAESPLWEEDENVLRFVDIVNSAVYRVHLSEGPSPLEKQTYKSAICVTAELASRGDSFIYGGKYGIGIGSKTSNKTELLCSYWPQGGESSDQAVNMRANDGGVDSLGRFWVSVLCDPEVTTFTPTAVLFRLDLDGILHRVLGGMTIPNGMSWSKYDTTLYLTDTNDRAIYAYDYNAQSGSVSNRRLFFRTEKRTGPDGHAQDEYGNLWVAVWGAWKVVRVTPQGNVTAEIKFPTRCITAVAFAGETIYVTSEKDPEGDVYPDSVRYQGAVFKCHVGVKGKPSNVARIRSIA